MKIYDCFIFYNELDLLEVRLNELYNVVDYFVLVEAERTHQGDEKPLFFLNSINEDRFVKFKDKIIHIIVKSEEFKSGLNNSWYNDNKQRNKILDGLVDATEGDYILVSDLDEIPSAESVIRAIDLNQLPYVFQQQLHYTYLNTKLVVNGSSDNYGTVMLRKSLLESNTEIVRTPPGGKTNYFNIIPNGGWHFSYLGNSDFIYKKIHSYGHTEFNHISKEEINKRINELTDILGRPGHKLIINHDINYLPKYVLNNLNKFSKYIKK